MPIPNEYGDAAPDPQAQVAKRLHPILRSYMRRIGKVAAKASVASPKRHKFTSETAKAAVAKRWRVNEEPPDPNCTGSPR